MLSSEQLVWMCLTWARMWCAWGRALQTHLPHLSYVSGGKWKSPVSRSWATNQPIILLAHCCKLYKFQYENCALMLQNKDFFLNHKIHNKRLMYGNFDSFGQLDLVFGQVAMHTTCLTRQLLAHGASTCTSSKMKIVL